MDNHIRVGDMVLTQQRQLLYNLLLGSGRDITQTSCKGLSKENVDKRLPDAPSTNLAETHVSDVSEMVT